MTPETTRIEGNEWKRKEVQRSLHRPKGRYRAQTVLHASQALRIRARYFRGKHDGAVEFCGRQKRAYCAGMLAESGPAESTMQWRRILIMSCNRCKTPEIRVHSHLEGSRLASSPSTVFSSMPPRYPLCSNGSHKDLALYGQAPVDLSTHG
jgi:hypothetical protein